MLYGQNWFHIPLHFAMIFSQVKDVQLSWSFVKPSACSPVILFRCLQTESTFKKAQSLSGYFFFPLVKNAHVRIHEWNSPQNLRMLPSSRGRNWVPDNINDLTKAMKLYVAEQGLKLRSYKMFSYLFNLKNKLLFETGSYYFWCVLTHV